MLRAGDLEKAKTVGDARQLIERLGRMVEPGCGAIGCSNPVLAGSVFCSDGCRLGMLALRRRTSRRLDLLTGSLKGLRSDRPLTPSQRAQLLAVLDPPRSGGGTRRLIVLRDALAPAFRPVDVRSATTRVREAEQRLWTSISDAIDPPLKQTEERLVKILEHKLSPGGRTASEMLKALRGLREAVRALQPPA